MSDHVTTHQAQEDVRNKSLGDTYGADKACLTVTFGAQSPVSEIDGRVIELNGAYSDLPEQALPFYRKLEAVKFGP